MRQLATQFSLRLTLLGLMVFVMASLASVAGAQDDPLGGGDTPKAGSTAGEPGKDQPKVDEHKEDEKGGDKAEPKAAEPKPESSSFDPALSEFSKLGAMGYVYILVAAIVCWLVGWMILYLVVRRESPGNAGFFGCFTSAGLFLAFLTLVFFGWIVPAALPNWLVWTVVALVALGLIVFAVRLTGARRIVALLVGMLLLGGLVFLWMSRRPPETPATADTATSDATGDEGKASEAE